MNYADLQHRYQLALEHFRTVRNHAPALSEELMEAAEELDSARRALEEAHENRS